MQNVEKEIASKFESELMDTFNLSDESAMDLVATGADNLTPIIIAATVTGLSEC